MAEDTLTKTKEEEDALVAEMLRDVKVATEPGSILENKVVNKPSEDKPFPSVLHEVSSAGWVWIWDTRTYEKSRCLTYMLPSKLRQKRVDGSYIFTTRDPGKLPARGTIKCPLHPEGEHREQYDILGLPTCNKSNLRSPYMMEQHMKHKHPQEWAVIERERTTKEKEEDRKLQRMIAEGMVKKEEIIYKGGTEKHPCPDCDKVFTRKIALLGHQRTHKK